MAPVRGATFFLATNLAIRSYSLLFGLLEANGFSGSAAPSCLWARRFGTRVKIIFGGSELFRAHGRSWTVRSSLLGRPRTGQARGTFRSAYYGSWSRSRLVVSASSPRKLPHERYCAQHRRVPRSGISWPCRLNTRPGSQSRWWHACLL